MFYAKTYICPTNNKQNKQIFMANVYSIPILHITNYQQYIDADYLFTKVIDNLPQGINWPETINISIAYMQVTKKLGIFTTTVALSIIGRTYKIKLQHGDKLHYLAQYGLDLNSYANQAVKDNHIRLYQQAFEACVNKNIKQIIKALTTAYAN